MGRAEGRSPTAFLSIPQEWGIKGVETGFMKQYPSLDSCFRRNDNIRSKDTSQLRICGAGDQLLRRSVRSLASPG
jgi:hypothetical protein